MKNFIFLFAIIFPLVYLLQSCQEKLKDFKPSAGADQKVVIDAFVSDSIGANYIIITKTKDLLDQNPVPTINNATAILTDGQGLVDTFQVSPQLSGYYFPSKIWKGVAGRTYSLNVIIDGQTYIAASTMPVYQAAFKIDSLKQDYRRSSADNSIRVLQPRDSTNLKRGGFNTLNYDGKNYLKVGDTLIAVRLYAFAQPTQRVNLITKVYRNGRLFRDNNIKLNNLFEAPVNTFFINPPGGGGAPQTLNFAKGDTVTVALAGISDESFNYFNAVNAVNNNDGGLFNSPPGNPKSSFDNGAIGCFRAVRLTSRTIVIR